MPFMTPPRPTSLLIASGLLALLMVGGPAHAERADRSKPLDIMADQQGTIDMLKRVIVFTGNVVITKGTLTIKADRVEVREGADGFRTAVATGAGRAATFRQKRDGVDEYIDGQAERLEYEERRELIRFVNNATVRRLRGSTVGDEITGNLVTYDGTSELFTVSGGAPRPSGSPAPAQGERVRAVLVPREGTEAAAAAQQGAASSAPATTGAPR